VKVLAKLDDGSALELEIGNEEDGKVFARKPGGERVTVATYQLFNFRKTVADFKPPAPEPVVEPAPEVPATGEPADDGAAQDEGGEQDG
jgi:hypothetical protein